MSKEKPCNYRKTTITWANTEKARKCETADYRKSAKYIFKNRLAEWLAGKSWDTVGQLEAPWEHFFHLVMLKVLDSSLVRFRLLACGESSQISALSVLRVPLSRVETILPGF